MTAEEDKKGVCYLCSKKGHRMTDYYLLKLLIKMLRGACPEAEEGSNQTTLTDYTKDILWSRLEVGDRASTEEDLSEEDPNTTIKVGAREVTTATTSRT